MERGGIHATKEGELLTSYVSSFMFLSVLIGIEHSNYSTHLTGSSFINYPKNALNDQSFLLIMRASHVIKGASSNLMCQQLREGATNLEQSAAQANELPRDDKASLEAGADKVKEKYALLKEAVDNYHEFLNKTGI